MPRPKRPNNKTLLMHAGLIMLFVVQVVSLVGAMVASVMRKGWSFETVLMLGILGFLVWLGFWFYQIMCLISRHDRFRDDEGWFEGEQLWYTLRHGPFRKGDPDGR